MSHLDDGTLQAFLDDELPTAERADAAEHLLGCERCRAAKDDLAQAHAAFAEAVAVLDVDPGRPAPVSGPRIRRPVIRAAVLVLLLAAAASAAVPGSPVRTWILEREPEAPPAAPESEVEPAPTPAAPAGVSVTDSAVDIMVTGLEGVSLRLVETDGSRVTVTAAGGSSDPKFKTIEVQDGVGGELTIEWPASLDRARLVVDGRVYAEKADGALRVHEPAEAVEGGRIWR